MMENRRYDLVDTERVALPEVSEEIHECFTQLKEHQKNTTTILRSKYDEESREKTKKSFWDSANPREITQAGAENKTIADPTESGYLF